MGAIELPKLEGFTVWIEEISNIVTAITLLLFLKYHHGSQPYETNHCQ